MSLAKPFRLKCEYLTDPLGIGTPFPRFSWISESDERGEGQTACRIIVSSEKEFAEREAGDYWDSGKLETDRNAQVQYNGEPLLSGKRYYWRVRCWDRRDRVTAFSEPAFFETGLLNEKDWKARWISQKNPREFRSKGSHMLGVHSGESIQMLGIYLRKEFKVKRRVRRARAYVSGLGWYEFRLNGEKIGDRVLDPGQTDYRRAALYSTYDITDILRERNVLAVILGNGRHVRDFGFDQPKLVLQVHLEYEDEDFEKVVSDGTWKAGHGPLQENSLYGGERYDARLEQEGWDRPGFDDSSWEPAAVLAGPPLTAGMIPPIRIVERRKPTGRWSPSAGVFVFDFGQNFTGWVKLYVQGSAGTAVTMRYAELVHENGGLNVLPNQNAEAKDVYVLKGGGPETYEPRFTYHGFRYVEITGFPGEPGIDHIEGCVVHTDVDSAGQFSSADALLNRIHRNILWGQLSNLMSIPTDCPQRDERHGWLGDAHLSAEEAIFNFDMAAFYTKFLDDIRLSQKPDGSLSDTVPPYLERMYPADPAWAAAYYELAWLMYFYYEDTRVLERHYAALRKYLDFLAASAEGHIIKKLGKYGDWCQPASVVPKKTPLALTSTFYYYRGLILLARFAGILSRFEDVKVYSGRSQEVKTAFNQAFLKDGQYDVPRISPADRSPDQTANILPLSADMAPGDQREKVLAKLLHSLVTEHDCHLDTGILGTRYLFDVLTAAGQDEIAYKIASQKSYPGWGYMVGEGATTLWERWDKLGGAGMNSQNHIMFGCVDVWFYKVVAGLSALDPGWKRIQVKPPLIEGLDSASADLQTVRGDISLSWKKEGCGFKIHTRIPCGVAAEVFIPVASKNPLIKENGIILLDKDGPKTDVPGISFLKNVVGYAIFGTGSGSYEFISENVTG